MAESAGGLLAQVLAAPDGASALALAAERPDVVIDGGQAVVWRAPAVRAVLTSTAVTVEMGDRNAPGERLVDRLPAMTDDPEARTALADLRPLLMPTRVEAARGTAADIAAALIGQALATGEPVIDLAVVADLVTPLFLRRYLGLDAVVDVRDVIDTSRDISVVVLADHGLLTADRHAEIGGATERLQRFDEGLQAALPGIATDPAHPLHDVARVHPGPLVAAAVAQVIVGGMDTVSSSICRAVMVWSQRGGRPLTRSQAEALWDETVAEHPPIQVIARRAREAIRIDAESVPGGLPIVIPTRLAVATDDRAGDRSLAFGWGEHRCVGRAVARVVAVETLLAVAAAWPAGPGDPRPSGRRFPWVFDGPAQLDLPNPRFLPASGVGHAREEGATHD